MNSSKIQKTLPQKVEDEQNIVSDHVYTLDMLPPEVLEMIFKHLSYDEISRTIRLVSRRFQNIATSLLNNAFLMAGTKLKTIERYLAEQILTVKGEVEVLNCHRAYNAMELIKTQYQMLKAVTWRYTHPVHCQTFVRLCLYAGSLLDVLFKLLAMLKTNPYNYSPLHKTVYINDFIAICKRFMNHFEKVSERRVNKSPLVSGCKTIDILDCLAEGREVQAFRICANRGKKKGMICMKIKYVIKRAWFTCLEVANALNENSWTDEQRFMYLRLRRLVDSVNAQLYKNKHFDTEIQHHTPQEPLPRRPSTSIYSGYGEYGGRFFYYGNMNKFAYENKFNVMLPNEWADSESEEENSIRENEPKNAFNLVITAEIRCSPELAPFAIKPVIQLDDFNTVSNMDKNLELYLKLHVTCHASVSNRLPGNFTWEIRTPCHVKEIIRFVLNY